MGKMILGFLAIFALVYFAIQIFVSATGREKFQLIKGLSYTIVITAMVVLIIASIIVLF